MSRRARGFTLLEVLVAFVILAVAMGMLLAMLSRGLGQVRRAQDETEASLHAQSLLDALGVIEPLAEGERHGEFEGGRYRYRLQVREVEDPTPEPEAAPGAPPAPEAIAGPKLFRIALQVSRGEAGPRQQLDYVTLRARTPPLLGNSP
jgi:general secretion pathway protein I